MYPRQSQTLTRERYECGGSRNVREEPEKVGDLMVSEDSDVEINFSL